MDKANIIIRNAVYTYSLPLQKNRAMAVMVIALCVVLFE